jgi:hypothetical protein
MAHAAVRALRASTNIMKGGLAAPPLKLLLQEQQWQLTADHLLRVAADHFLPNAPTNRCFKRAIANSRASSFTSSSRISASATLARSSAKPRRSFRRPACACADASWACVACNCCCSCWHYGQWAPNSACRAPATCSSSHRQHDVAEGQLQSLHHSVVLRLSCCML